MGTETQQEFLDAIDYDENGELLSGVVIGTSWADVFQHKMDLKKE